MACTSLGGVLVYWRFEENGGNYAYDEINSSEYGGFRAILSGFYGNPPPPAGIYVTGWSTNVPVSVISQTGVANTGSLRFFGGGGTAGEHIDFSVAAPPLTLGPAFTIECYLNYVSISTVSTLLNLGAGDFAPVSMSLVFLNWNDELKFIFGLNGVGYEVDVAEAFTFNEWHHMALVKDGSDAYFYLDGLLLSTLSLSDDADDTFTFNPSWPGDRYISSWDGWVDEFRISNEALSPKDFLNYYAAVPEPGTLALLALGSGVLALRRRKRVS